jgi:hypothetical protein
MKMKQYTEEHCLDCDRETVPMSQDVRSRMARPVDPTHAFCNVLFHDARIVTSRGGTSRANGVGHWDYAHRFHDNDRSAGNEVSALLGNGLQKTND